MEDRLPRITADTNQRIAFDIEPCGRHLGTGGQVTYFPMSQFADQPDVMIINRFFFGSIFAVSDVHLCLGTGWICSHL
jgi:hypothetical protein